MLLVAIMPTTVTVFAIKKLFKKANNKLCLILDFNLLTINSMTNEFGYKNK